MDDCTWLRAYAEHGSQQAFTRLVERHMGLVYSAALRQVPRETDVWFLVDDKGQVVPPDLVADMK